MEQFQIIFICVFLFRIIQCTNSMFDGLVSSDLKWKYYEKLAKDFISEHLSGTKYCESILLHTEPTLTKSLQTKLFSAWTDSSLNAKNRLDSCCRSLYKCDAYKINELNGTVDRNNFLHCNCVLSFKTCLKQLNTSLSSDLAFIHSINATKCYATDYPIVKCVKQEELTGSASQHLRFMSTILSDIFFNRCTKYEIDESQPKKLQVFDLPLIVPGTCTSLGKCGKENVQVVTPVPGQQEAITTEPPKIWPQVLKSILDLLSIVSCDRLNEVKSKKTERQAKNINDIGRVAYEILSILMEAYCGDTDEDEKSHGHKIQINSNGTTWSNISMTNVSFTNFTLNFN